MEVRAKEEMLVKGHNSSVEYGKTHNMKTTGHSIV